MDLVKLILENPLQVVTIVALLLVGFLVIELYRAFKNRLGKSDEDFTENSKLIRVDLKETRHELRAVRDSLGKATKALQGEMLTVKENLFQLKTELVTEINNVKSLSTQTAHALTLANETARVSMEALNEKYGKIIHIEKLLDTHSNQITKLQESGGGHATTLAKHNGWFGDVARSLKLNKEKLDSLIAEQAKAKNEIR